VLAEEDVNNKQSIHIFKCEDSVIKIGGKVNEILIGVGFNLFAITFSLKKNNNFNNFNNNNNNKR